MECRVAISLYRLGSGNTLILIVDLFGLEESTTSKIVKKCCEAIRILLKPLIFKKLALVWMKKIVAEFKALHGIPLIIEAIDGSHIPIIAPIHNSISYYCRKRFYSCLLLGVVDSKYKFWDYDFGWCGRIHDWALFQKIEIGKKPWKVHFFLLSSLVMPLIPWGLGFIHHSKERRMDYLTRKHSGILYNQVLEWL